MVIAAALPFPWFLCYAQSRSGATRGHTPEDGITRGGYRLTYSDTPPGWLKAAERPDAFVGFSIGFSVRGSGDLGSVLWDSPAFKAGITPDMHLNAVNGKAFSIDVLREAIKDAEKDSAPIKLLVKRGDESQTIDIDYHGGLRYPALTRVDGTPDRLDEILAAK
jgi:predicted metalloprotease with PDZ domain